MGKWILETPRLRLRQLEEGDRAALAAILQDAETMRAYEHPFTDDEVRQWLDNQLRRYREEGMGLWAVCLKEGEAAQAGAAPGLMIGQCGLTWQPVPDDAGLGPVGRVPEVGYLFNRAWWHRGYAAEAAMACRDYALEVLGFPAVYAIIRDSNAPSMAVARRCGMRPMGGFTKHYYGVDMPHVVFGVARGEG